MNARPVEPQRRGDVTRVAGGPVAVAPDEVAAVGRRFVAYVVDGAVIGLAIALGTLVAMSLVDSSGQPSVAGLLPPLLALVVAVGQWFAEALTGATVGGATLGIRTVSVRTGRPAGVLPILLRNLVVAAGALVCLVGQVVVVVSGLWDREPAQRGWHDKAAGTLVVRAGAVGRSARSAGVAWGGARPRPEPVDPRSAWETAVARSVEPVPSAPDAPIAQASSPYEGAAASPRTAAVPVFAPPPPSPPADPKAPAAPAPALVEGPPETAAVPVVRPPAPAGPGLVEVPAGLADARRVGAPVRPALDVPLAPEPPAPQSPPRTSSPQASGPQTSASQASALQKSAAEPPAPQPRSTDPQRFAAAAAGTVEAAQPATGLVPVVRHADPARPVDRSTGRPEPLAGRDTAAWAGPAASHGLGDLEHTRLRDDAPGTPASRLRLVFDTGERVVVEGDGLVGRSPSSDGVTHVVAVDDPERSVSKVHLAFGLAADGRLWVVDRGSTNGTFLVAPDGAGTALTPGTRSHVEPGWTIRFGQRSARVERA